MNDKYLKILKILEGNNGNYVKISDFSSALNVSNRTIMRYLSILMNMDTNHSIVIESSKSKGYRLVVLDEECFHKFKNELVKKENYSDDQRDLMFRMIVNRYVKITSLEEDMNYSPSSINRKIASINAKLKSQNVEIVKNKNLIFLSGDEIRIRSMGTMIVNENHDMLNRLNQMQSALIYEAKSLLKKLDISIAESDFHYLCVSLIRIQQGNFIKFNNTLKCLVQSALDDMHDVQKFKEGLLSRFLMDLNDDELLFLSLIIAKGEDSIIDNNEIYSQLYPILQKIFMDVDVEYSTNFHKDTELITSIDYHISNALSDYILLSSSNNSLINEIRLNLTNEHCIALELSEKLYKLLNIEISDKDIGYLTLHIANSAERNKGIKQIRTCVVYENNLSAARLLKTRVESVMRDIDFVDVVERKSLNEEDYDLVLAFEDSISQYLSVSPFLNEIDAQSIKDRIIQIEGMVPLLNLCRKHLFYVFDGTNKDSLLDIVLKDLLDKEYLNDDEVNRLLQRESLSSTEIALDVAFPHVTVSKQSFLAVIVCKNEVEWKHNKVRLVFLMGFNSQMESKKTVKYLFNKIKDESVVRRLMDIRVFEEFIEIMKG